MLRTRVITHPDTNVIARFVKNLDAEGYYLNGIEKISLRTRKRLIISVSVSEFQIDRWFQSHE